MVRNSFARPLLRRHRGNLSFLFIALGATGLVALVSAIGSAVVAAAVVGALLLAPFLVLVDGAPAIFLLLVLPPASLLTNYTVGLGGFKVLTVFALLCWLGGLALGSQTVRWRPNVLDAGVAGLLLAALANIVILTQGAAGPLNLIQEYAGDLVIYMLIRLSVCSRERLRFCLWGYCLGAGVAALVGLWRFGAGLIRLEEGLPRLVIPGQNINAFGSLMVIAAAFALGLAISHRSSVGRWLWVTTAISFAGVAAMTYSRGAFVGMAAAVLFGLLFGGDMRVRLASATVMIGSVTAAALGLLPALGLSDYAGRIAGIASLSYDTTAQRTILWAMGWHTFLTHWLFGLGIGNFAQPAYWYPLAFEFQVPRRGFFAFPQVVHSFYIGWAADAGIIGLLFLAVSLAGALALLWRATRNRPENDSFKGLSHALLLGFVGYFVYLASSPEQNAQLPYVMLALVGSLAALTAIRSAVPEAQEDERLRASGTLAK